MAQRLHGRIRLVQTFGGPLPERPDRVGPPSRAVGAPSGLHICEMALPFHAPTTGAILTLGPAGPWSARRFQEILEHQA